MSTVFFSFFRKSSRSGSLAELGCGGEVRTDVGRRDSMGKVARCFDEVSGARAGFLQATPHLAHHVLRSAEREHGGVHVADQKMIPTDAAGDGLQA